MRVAVVRVWVPVLVARTDSAAEPAGDPVDQPVGVSVDQRVGDPVVRVPREVVSVRVCSTAAAVAARAWAPAGSYPAVL